MGNPAILHEGNPRSGIFGVFRLMRDHKDCQFPFLLNLPDEIEHVTPQRRPQRRKGFIQQQHGLVPHQSAGNGDTLPFTAR